MRDLIRLLRCIGISDQDKVNSYHLDTVFQMRTLGEGIEAVQKPEEKSYLEACLFSELTLEKLTLFI